MARSIVPFFQSADVVQPVFEICEAVLAVSFLSLGLRPGLVVALAIPLVLEMTFVALEYLGISLQRISLGALIIALGLLVDDAMIAVEMMVSPRPVFLRDQHLANERAAFIAHPRSQRARKSVALDEGVDAFENEILRIVTERPFESGLGLGLALGVESGGGHSQ